MAKLHRQHSHRIYIKYSKKDGDRKIVSTRFVIGKILCPICTMTVKWNAFHIWPPSEMYLQMRQNFPMHRMCCSVAFLCFHDTKEQKKSFPSLYVLTQWCHPCLHCANEGCKEQVSRICVPESLTCPPRKCTMLVCDAASVSVDFSQAQVERKKNSKLHPQKKVGSDSLSP